MWIFLWIFVQISVQIFVMNFCMDFCTNLCMDFCPNFCKDFLSEFPYRFLYGFLCQFSSLFVTPSFPISVVLCRMLLSQLEPTECNPFPTFPRSPLPLGSSTVHTRRSPTSSATPRWSGGAQNCRRSTRTPATPPSASNMTASGSWVALPCPFLGCLFVALLWIAGAFGTSFVRD